MITKQDCLLMLADIDNSNDMIRKVASEGPTLEVIEFINNHRPLYISQFYDKIRKSYNDKKSQLYINIVKEKDDIDTVLTTLSALQLQIFLFSKNINDTDRSAFLRHARIDELSHCIYNYSKNSDLIPCIKLLQLYKADLKAFEYIKNKE